MNSFKTYVDTEGDSYYNLKYFSGMKSRVYRLANYSDVDQPTRY